MPRNRATALSLAISLVFLAGVVWWATQQEAPELPSSGTELLALAGAIALYAVNTMVRAERWHALLRQAGATPRRADTYALTVIGYTGNNVLPARAGDAVRVVLAAPRAATSMRTVVGTLLAERVLDVAVVITLFLLVGYAALGAVSRGDLEIIALATAAALVAVAIGVVVLRRSERALRFVKPMLASMLSLRRGRHGGRMLAVTVVIWWLESVVWMATAAAVGLHMNPLEALYIVGLASVFALIPSGPAYVGTQDAAVVIAVKALGGGNSLAVSYILMLRFVIVVPITVVGFVLLAARYGGISQLRVAREQARAVEPR